MTIIDFSTSFSFDESSFRIVVNVYGGFPVHQFLGELSQRLSNQTGAVSFHQ